MTTHHFKAGESSYLCHVGSFLAVAEEIKAMRNRRFHEHHVTNLTGHLSTVRNMGDDMSSSERKPFAIAALEFVPRT